MRPSENIISRRKLLSGLVLGGLAARVSHAQDLYGVSALTEGAGMVRIAPGEFRMGAGDSNPDEQPVHRVRITRPFEIGKFEVTQAQWAGVLADAHPRPGITLQNSQGQEVSLEPSHFKGPALPVESVSWDDVQLFLARLNTRDPSHHYRLPTEAEWEYACGPSNQPGWTEQTSDGHTHAVGQLAPNTRGLFDMQGNVAEWVHDWYGRGYYAVSPENDPAGPEAGSYRVFRGGSWLDAEKRCHPAFRGFDFPVNRVYNVGFRVVRTVT
ncbi:MAG TPA: formylglycine-generating enzyme family protein [Solibacterales bacterium]|nr:formylglycine-generating enzyme family protein [Bryobacterales bacterium]